MESNNEQSGSEDETRKRLETLQKYAEEEIKYCDKLIKEKEAELKEFMNLSKKVEHFPKKLQHRDEWIPICDVAFIKGNYTDTNRFQVMIGNNFFVEKSANETVQFINRRIKNTQKEKEGFEKQKELASSRLEFAQELFEHESEMIEIKDEYSEEKMKRKPTLLMDEITENESDKIMEMLDRLELEEKENDELEKMEESSKSKRYSEMAGGRSMVSKNAKATKERPIVSENKDIPKKPKGVSQEEFDKLLQQVDAMSSSEDSEDYDDEDLEDFSVGSKDTEELDSDDSMDEEQKQSPKKQVKMKRSVHFPKELEAGPSPSAHSTEKPKSILKNKAEKTPVDEKAFKEMSGIEKPRTILPQTDVCTFSYTLFKLYLSRHSKVFS